MLTTYTLGDQPYQVYRAGMEGPVLLLVHGFPMNHVQWENQFLHFSATCRVIAPDLRGLGGSRVLDDHAVVTMEQHADDLHALLQELHISEPVIFVGLSMGGYVAWQMARKYPQSLRGLVLCHTRIIADTAEQASARHQLAEQTLKDNSSLKIEETMLPRLLPPDADHHIVELVRQMARSSSVAGLVAALRGMAQRPEMSQVLSTIRAPTLAISGERDAISPPSEMSAWASQIPQAKFVTLPKVGHLSPLESPNAFNQLLSESLPWLTGTTSR